MSRIRDTHRVDDLLSFCLDSSVESSLSHSIRLVFSNIVMILGWSYPKCLDPHVYISEEYMSDLLYIP